MSSCTKAKTQVTQSFLATALVKLLNKSYLRRPIPKPNTKLVRSQWILVNNKLASSAHLTEVSTQQEAHRKKRDPFTVILLQGFYCCQQCIVTIKIFSV